MTVEGRKTRSDKKRAIAAPLTAAQYEQIFMLSYLCELPMKTIGEALTMKGYEKDEVVGIFQAHLKRNLSYKTNRFLFGHLDNETYRLFGKTRKRLSMRLRTTDYELISQLAYAMDLSVQSAAASIITEVLRKDKLMYDIMAQLIKNNLDEATNEQIRNLASQINMKSPQEYITLSMVLAYALEKAIEEQVKVRIILNGWLRNIKVV
ncbi:hypothetical protein [Paenibacillus glucanolyticus]|uniref:hypothetical protein n=1 Tax=Paenibacillus glucanolyticus TaxID=59843 RepID=UPI00096DB3A3|nr:hypothetical protein [Paenibacillus glucanolyticus]OMF76673.1 hypothetical protein BK142_14210 [Paenibacillus glucanolyticus]